MIELPPVPDNEIDRLKALRSYNILDSLPEKEYDAITRLASYICQAPVAMITLIDNDRQWIKSKVGVNVEETPRQDSFCRYTILDDQVLEVPDSLKDERFKDNVFVQDAPHVRFYAGAPLIDDNGFRLGSLCVIDLVPRTLTTEQRDALQILAREVISHLSLRKQKKELEQSLQTHREFESLFNNSPDIHCITNNNSEIELINKSVNTILGYEPEEAIGKPIWEFFASEEFEDALRVLKKGYNRHKAFEIEVQVKTKTGQTKWIDWCITAQENKWYASGRDVSYQKKVVAQLEQLSLVASKVSNGVAITDAANNVVWINDAFEKITGFGIDDINNKQLSDVLKGDYTNQAIFDKTQNLLKSKKAFEIDLQICRKDGESLWISVISSVILDDQGDIEKYIKVIIDISERKKSEQDLEILSFAARKSPGGILIRDKAGKVLWMNEPLEQILGYSRAEMSGKTFGHMLLGEDTDLTVFETAVQAVAENRPYEVELKIYKKDKTPIWIFITNSPLFNEAGQVDRQVAVLVDITERKKADQQLSMLSLVASNSVSGVVINNEKGEVEWVNDAFTKITGYHLRDVQDKHLGDVLKGELTDVAIIEKSRELSKNKQSFEVDLLVYRKDGQPLWISVINSVILNSVGKVDKYIEVIIDITAKKKAELQLIAAKEEALQLNRAKDIFIGVMSHEIRTPLNAVIGMSHLLLDDNPLPSQTENLNVLKFSAENLMMLINDVLDFTKIETGNIELEKVNLNLRELVKSVTASMQYKASGKDIYLKANIDEDIPQLVLGDYTRLCQILLNITSNAVKFTDQGGITIDLKIIEQTAKIVRIRFAVSDTGIGIPADKIGTIFESFKQAEADTTRKYGGTGLGLAISKRLVDLHESRINVDSVLGHGSTFWFTISFNKTDERSNNTSSKVEEALNINILVADDNQINRLLINKVLKKWGVTADFAENGAEAVQKIEANQTYDVVLMDIHMPEMGGIEATKIIRARPEPYFQRLVIIALTASMLNNQMGEIGLAGMNDYVLKPFEPKMLYDKLVRYQKQ